MAMRRNSSFDGDSDSELPVTDGEPIVKTSSLSLDKLEQNIDSQKISKSISEYMSDAKLSSSDDVEEKARLISQVLELQNTLDDLTNRVDSVKEENMKLRTENDVLGQYINNLVKASKVFEPINSRKPTNGLGSVIRASAKAAQEEK